MGTTETGAEGIAEIGAEGIVETGAEGIAETGAEGVAETGAVGATGGVTVGIAMPVATSGFSKVSVIRRIDIQNEWRLHQEVMWIQIKRKGKKMATTKGKEENLTNMRDTYP